ncbi:MAG: hypothetical protein BWY04_00698 [candidate division CPR1 bacterium ADurb.Bin160]|uniref:Uncharacterized protein n=1 Tax=candidate division CPR1 bacterium ADurb.Bin160 TaxID=1852826 RepID=A0A1V5ZNW5_9BACT|nr:MAG: hypothetical protein BWY04_00698 [candidate division CPR1 bacterium ADurb.Bin160]
MKKQCIICKKIWGEWNGNEDRKFYSSGLCKECAKTHLIPKIRANQIKEGNPDCFGKSNGYCDQNKCIYRNVCLNLNKEEIYFTEEEDEKNIDICSEY